MKVCLICNSIILAKSKQYKNKKYCSKKCKNVAYRKRRSIEERLDRKRTNLKQNDETLVMIRQCRRAKTVQILSGHTVESLFKTMKLIRDRPNAKINLCHIAPVNGSKIIGKFHHENLFYGGAYQNKKFGNNWTGKGKYILKSKVDEGWAVNDSMTNIEVIHLIENFLGEVLVKYIEKHPVRKSRRASLINAIMKVSNDGFIEDELFNMSYKDLSILKSQLEENGYCKIWSAPPESKYLTYIQELDRFSYMHKGDKFNRMRKIRNMLVIGYIALEKIPDSKTFNTKFYSSYGEYLERFGYIELIDASKWSRFKDFMYDSAFRTLQGEELNTKKLYKRFKKYIDI